MNLYAPLYYLSFECIADRCRHSCCVGWEIDVDEETLEKYGSSKELYAERIRDSIERDEAPHFNLCEGDRCPHLCENGLCRIILEVGEDYLCNICREHPRFYNDTVRGREVGLGLVCEEACRIILGSDDYDVFTELEEDYDEGGQTAEFDAIAERGKIYAVLKKRSIPYFKRLELIEKEYGVSPSDIPDDRWRELISSLEYLDEEDRELFAPFSSGTAIEANCDVFLERALAYFIYRHTSAAEDINDFRASLGLALFLERLLCSAVGSQGDFGFDTVCDITRRLSEELEYSEENTEVIKFEFVFG